MVFNRIQRTLITEADDRLDSARKSRKVHFDGYKSKGIFNTSKPSFSDYLK